MGAARPLGLGEIAAVDDNADEAHASGTPHDNDGTEG
jgi:hypothetical protein